MVNWILHFCICCQSILQHSHSFQLCSLWHASPWVCYITILTTLLSWYHMTLGNPISWGRLLNPIFTFVVLNCLHCSLIMDVFDICLDSLSYFLKCRGRIHNPFVVSFMALYPETYGQSCQVFLPRKIIENLQGELEREKGRGSWYWLWKTHLLNLRDSLWVHKLETI